jgi:hypothetical protein
MRRAIVVAAFSALCAASSAARADGDGVYGRFDGDLELRAHAGAAFAKGGPGLAAGISALYLSTAGIYAHYTDALGGEAPIVKRSIAAGVHLAPLFLARYAINGERGGAYFDLLLDSFAFELGAFWAEPRGGPFGKDPGLELALGFDVPLLPRSTGPFLGLRGALRWRASDFAAGAKGDLADRGALLSLTLGWHHVIRSGLVDAGDGRAR